MVPLFKKLWSRLHTIRTGERNILGIVGVAILTVLVLMSIPMILQYGKGILSDAEGSYKWAVMKNDGEESGSQVPRTAPSICAQEIDNSNLPSIAHTFTT